MWISMALLSTSNLLTQCKQCMACSATSATLSVIFVVLNCLASSSCISTPLGTLYVTPAGGSALDQKLLGGLNSLAVPPTPSWCCQKCDLLRTGVLTWISSAGAAGGLGACHCLAL